MGGEEEDGGVWEEERGGEGGEERGKKGEGGELGG